MANLAVSAVCNQSCAYCFTVDHLERRAAADFLPPSAFDERLGFLKRSGLDEVRLLGGEPSLHPQFVRLVERARAVAREVTVFSNGLMPDSALDCLAALPVQGCTVVVNVNEPGGTKNGAYRRQVATMQRLGKRAIPGFNIYRTDFQPEFLLNLVAETGCTPNVRLSLAQPCLSGQNRSIHPNQYRAVALKIARFAEVAARAGVTLDFDCGFVRCMFSRPELEALQAAGAHVAWQCSPILDVDLEGNVIHCYPLAQLLSLPLTPATDAAALRCAFEARTRPYRQAGVFPECSTCPFKAQGECSGGCLAATIRRFRRTPFRLEVAA